MLLSINNHHNNHFVFIVPVNSTLRLLTSDSTTSTPCTTYVATTYITYTPSSTGIAGSVSSSLTTLLLGLGIMCDCYYRSGSDITTCLLQVLVPKIELLRFSIISVIMSTIMELPSHVNNRAFY